MDRNRTALLTIELKFHPPPDPLQPSTQQTRQPFSLLTHRNALEKPLLQAMRAQVTERKKSKKGVRKQAKGEERGHATVVGGYCGHRYGIAMRILNR